MDDHLYTFALTVFTGFFAIMNPIANTPIFMGLTQELDEQGKKLVAKKACLIALLIELSFIVMGKYIFELFGITIPAFKLTGGILLFFIGFEMLYAHKSKVHSNQSVKVDIDSVAVSPLAIPILAGPGTIVTGMNFAGNGSFLKLGIVAAIFFIMILLTYLSFVLSDQIVKKLGRNMIAVIGKIMGLIIAIIGTDMIITGIKLAFNIQGS
jgi:multiple antibiotic resistance protein